jgi:hypothetical protein
MHHQTVIPQRAALLLAVLAACALLAACGSASSSSKKSTSASSSTSSSSSSRASSSRGRFFADRGKLLSCLKSHGVTLPAFHRASASGSRPPAGGAFFGGGGGGFHRGAFANPKVQAALKACGANFPHGAGSFTQSAAFKNRLERFVACVKKNGYALPSPNLSGKGPVFPASIEKDAKFQSAAKSCASLLRGPTSGGSADSGG